MTRVPSNPLRGADISPTQEASFWSLVRLRLCATQCWEWCGETTELYPRFKIGTRRYTGGRVAYAIAYGYVPQEAFVCHRCDNPKCVRPDHLFLGSATENMTDKMQKGREARGERAGCVKLTEAQVAQILSSPKTAREVGAEFGVGKSTVNKIRSGVNWKHVPRL